MHGFIDGTYGPRLGVVELAQVFRLDEQAVRRQIKGKRFRLEIRKEDGHSWVDSGIVAAYFDALRGHQGERGRVSLRVQGAVFDAHGPRLTMDELAGLLATTARALYNEVSAGKLVVRTHVDDRQRWADFRDAAESFETLRGKLL